MGTSKQRVRLILSWDDPLDRIIMEELRNQKKKAKFVKMAVFCYIKGLVAEKGGPPERKNSPAVEIREKNKLIGIGRLDPENLL